MTAASSSQKDDRLEDHLRLSMTAICETFDEIVNRYVDGVPMPITFTPDYDHNSTLNLRYQRDGSSKEMKALEYVPLLAAPTGGSSSGDDGNDDQGSGFAPVSNFDALVHKTTPSERIASSYSPTVGFMSPRRLNTLTQSAESGVVLKPSCSVVGIPRKKFSNDSGILPLSLFLRKLFPDMGQQPSFFLTDAKDYQCFANGRWYPCRVLDFSSEKLLYTVEFEAAGSDGRPKIMTKDVSRAGILFPSEDLTTHEETVAMAKRERTQYERNLRFELFLNIVEDDPHGTPVSLVVLKRILKKATASASKTSAATVSEIIADVQNDCNQAVRIARLNYLLLHPHHRKMLEPLAFEAPQEERVTAIENVASRELVVSGGSTNAAGNARAARKATRKILEKTFVWSKQTGACMAQIRDVWLSKFAGLALIDVRITKSDRVTISQFMDNNSTILHAASEVLQMQYIPEIDTTMMVALKGRFSYSFPSVDAFQKSEFARFFKVVHVEVSLRLRRLIERALEDLGKFFSIDNVPSVPALFNSCTDDYYRCPGSIDRKRPKLVFKIETHKEDDSMIATIPTVDVFVASVHSLIEDIVATINALPRLECVALTALGYPRTDINCVSKHSDFVVRAKKLVSEAAADAKPFIDQLVSSYSSFCPNAPLPSREEFFAGGNVAPLAAELTTVRKIIDQIQWCSADEVMCGTFIVDCSEAKKTLLNKWRNREGILTEYLITQIEEVCSNSCDRLIDIEIRLSQRPTTAEEMHELMKFSVDAMKTVHKIEKKTFKEVLSWVHTSEELFIALPSEVTEVAFELFSWQNRITKVFAKSEELFVKEREAMVQELLDFRKCIEGEIDDFTSHINELYNMTEMDQVGEAVSTVSTLSTMNEKIAKDVDRLHNREEILELPRSEFIELPSLVNSFECLHQFWMMVSESTGGIQELLETPASQVEVDSMIAQLEEWRRLLRAANRCLRGFPEIFLLGRKTESAIANFQSNVPLLQQMLRPGLRISHWKEISKRIGLPPGKELLPTDQTITVQILLSTIQDSGVSDYMHVIEEVSLQAAREHEVGTSLENMRAECRAVRLHFTFVSDSHTARVLTNAHEMNTTIDHFITAVQQIRLSPFLGSLAHSASEWESLLIRTQDTLSLWINVQEEWLQLRPVITQTLDANSLSGALLQEFKEADDTYCAIIEELDKPHQSLYTVLTFDSLPARLNHISEVMKSVRTGVLSLMDAKRQVFPRFYFVSDRDMLACLSSSDMDAIVALLPRMYASLRRLEVNRGEITAFITKDGVSIKNDGSLQLSNDSVEVWMAKMERSIQLSMRKSLKVCINEYSKTQLRQWIFKWNSQLVDLVCRLTFTKELREIISVTGGAGLRPYLRKVIRLLDEHFRMTAIPELTKSEKTVLANMLAHQLHSKETVEALIMNEINTVEELDAFPVLQAELTKDNDLNLTVCQTTHRYGFELFGNYVTPVIHNFNYNALRTLLLTLAAGSSALLLGSSSSGKTEQVSDLARVLGRYLCSPHCTRSISAVDMLSAVKGCAAIGGIVNFENVHTLPLSVLDTLKSGLGSLFNSRRAGNKTFMFNDHEIAFSPHFSCLATASGDKTTIPDVVFLAFRPINMPTPDFDVFARVFLCAHGFQNSAFSISASLGTLFAAGETLNPAIFNLRSMKRVLKRAADLRHLADDSDCVVLAVRDKIPRHVDDKCDALLSEWLSSFDEIEAPTATNDNLQVDPKFSPKTSTSTLVFGSPFSGKRAKLSSIIGKSSVVHITPSAALASQVYGNNLAVSRLIEKILRDNSDFIVLEDLRSNAEEWWGIFIDRSGNAAFSLEGETMLANATTKLIVRNESISHLSPFVISRFELVNCGGSRTWEEELERRLETMENSAAIGAAIRCLFKDMFSLVRSQHSATVMLHKVLNLVPKLVELAHRTKSTLQTIADGQELPMALTLHCSICAVVWIFAGMLDSEGKAKVNGIVRSHAEELTNFMNQYDSTVELLPSGGEYHEYFVTGSGWKKITSEGGLKDSHRASIINPALPMTQQYIPNRQTTIKAWMAETLVSLSVPVMISGEIDAGKSAFMHQMEGIESFVTHHFRCNPHSTADLLFETLNPKLFKRKGYIVGPHVGSKLLICVDDLHINATNGAMEDVVRHLCATSSATTVTSGPLKVVDYSLCITSRATDTTKYGNAIYRHFVELGVDNFSVKSAAVLVNQVLDAANVANGSLTNATLIENAANFLQIVHELFTRETKMDVRFMLNAADRVKLLIDNVCAEHFFKKATISEVLCFYSSAAGSKGELLATKYGPTLVTTAFGDSPSGEEDQVFCYFNDKKSVDVLSLDDSHRRVKETVENYNRNELLQTLRPDQAKRMVVSATAVVPVHVTSSFLQHTFALNSYLQPTVPAMFVSGDEFAAKQLVQFTAGSKGIPFFEFEPSTATHHKELLEELKMAMRYAVKGDKPLVVYLSPHMASSPIIPLMLDSLISERSLSGTALFSDSANSPEDDFISAGFTQICFVMHVPDAASIHSIRNTFNFARDAPIVVMESQGSDVETLHELVYTILRNDVEDEDATVTLSNMCMLLFHGLQNAGLNLVEEDLDRFTTSFARLYSRSAPTLKGIVRQSSLLSGTIQRFKDINLEQQQRKRELAPMLEELAVTIAELEKQIEKSSNELNELKSQFDKLETHTVNIVSSIEAKKHTITQYNDAAASRLEESAKALEETDPKQITALRLTISPPQKVKVLMEAICMLLGEKPDKARGASADYWSLSRHLMEDHSFIPRLTALTFESTSLPSLEKIRPIAELFETYRFTSVSTFAQCLCDHVMAIAQALETRERVTEMDNEIASSRVNMMRVVDDLEQKRDEVNKAADYLQRLRDSIEESRLKRQKLSDEADTCRRRLQNSSKLVTLVVKLSSLWETRSQQAHESERNNIGDLLITAAHLSFLGCAPAAELNRFMDVIQQQLIENSIPYTEDFSLQNALAQHPPLLYHQVYGINLHETESRIMAAVEHRAFVGWPLIVTTSKMFIHTLEQQLAASYGDCDVISMNSPHATKVLGNAMSQGHGVIVEHVNSREFPDMWKSLIPIASACQFGNGTQIIFDEERAVDVSPSFFVVFVTSSFSLIPGLKRHFCTFDVDESVSAQESILQTLFKSKSSGCTGLSQDLTHSMREVQMKEAQIEQSLEAAAAIAIQHREDLDDNPEMITVLHDEVAKVENSKRVIEVNKKKADHCFADRKAHWIRTASFMHSVHQELQIIGDMTGMPPLLSYIEDLASKSFNLNKNISAAIAPSKFGNLPQLQQERVVCQTFLQQVMEIYSPGWRHQCRSLYQALLLCRCATEAPFAGVASTLFTVEVADLLRSLLRSVASGNKRSQSAWDAVSADGPLHALHKLLADSAAVNDLLEKSSTGPKIEESPLGRLLLAFTQPNVSLNKFGKQLAHFAGEFVFTLNDCSTELARAATQAAVTSLARSDNRMLIHHAFGTKTPLMVCSTNSSRLERGIQRFCGSLERPLRTHIITSNTSLETLIESLQEYREGTDCVALVIKAAEGDAAVEKLLELFETVSLTAFPPVWVLLEASAPPHHPAVRSLCKRCLAAQFEVTSMVEHASQIVALGPVYKKDWRDVPSALLRKLLHGIILYHVAACARRDEWERTSLVEDDDLSMVISLLKSWCKNGQLLLNDAPRNILHVLKFVYGSRLVSSVEQQRTALLAEMFIAGESLNTRFQFGGLIEAADSDLTEFITKVSSMEAEIIKICCDPGLEVLHGLKQFTDEVATIASGAKISGTPELSEDEITTLDLAPSTKLVAKFEGGKRQVPQSIANKVSQSLSSLNTDISAVRKIWLRSLQHPKLFLQFYLNSRLMQLLSESKFAYTFAFLASIPQNLVEDTDCVLEGAGFREHSMPSAAGNVMVLKIVGRFTPPHLSEVYELEPLAAIKTSHVKPADFAVSDDDEESKAILDSVSNAHEVHISTVATSVSVGNERVGSFRVLIQLPRRSPTVPEPPSQPPSQRPPRRPSLETKTQKPRAASKPQQGKRQWIPASVDISVVVK